MQSPFLVKCLIFSWKHPRHSSSHNLKLQAFHTTFSFSSSCFKCCGGTQAGRGFVLSLCWGWLPWVEPGSSGLLRFWGSFWSFCHWSYATPVTKREEEDKVSPAKSCLQNWSWLSTRELSGLVLHPNQSRCALAAAQHPSCKIHVDAECGLWRVTQKTENYTPAAE